MCPRFSIFESLIDSSIIRILIRLFDLYNKMNEQGNIPETVMITYNYYKEGKSIKEIAKIRSLAKTTIQGHFEKLILNELVKLNEIVDEDKKEKILLVLRKEFLGSLEEIKNKLDNNVSYGEIKYVLAFLKLQKREKNKKKSFQEEPQIIPERELRNPPQFNKGILTVKELTKYIKNILESDSKLDHIFVKGEISNFRKVSSGHIYFILKDEESQIRCVFFSRSNKKLDFEIEDGMKVIVRGSVEVYMPRGEYDIIVEEMHPDGLGVLHLAFTQLKKKLEKEGLFLNQYKKIIPKFPKKIGVITSESGAALQDILKVLRKRYPIVRVLLFPTLVQGVEATGSIARSIELANQFSDIDVIILGRGGGSLEDLWSFNKEIVARAIFRSEIPIISAVGHETDFTIADFVSDKRAPTPSTAAEIAVPDISDLYVQIKHLQKRSFSSVQSILNLYRSQIDQISSRVIFKKPLEIAHKNYRKLDQISSNLKNIIIEYIQGKKEELRVIESNFITLNPKAKLQSYRMELNQKSYKLISNLRKIIELKRKNLELLQSKIEALNPKAILKRGYGIITSKNKILINSSDIEKGEDINVILHRGKIDAKVKKTYLE